MSEYFGRVIKVKTGGKTFTNPVHIEFEVPFDDDYTPNTSTVRIYNLSQDSRSKIKRGNHLNLEAGYGKDTGVILSGEIKSVRTEKSGTDRATILTVMDSHGTQNKGKYKKSFKKAVKSSVVIQSIAAAIGLKIKVLALPNDKLHKKGYNVNGRGLDAIQSLASDCGASFYFSRGFLYIRDIKKGDNINFQLSNHTGLIGTPESFTKQYQKKTTHGYIFTALLQYKVNTGAILTVNCPSVKGKYRIITGKHIATAVDFFTVFEGVS